MKRWRFSRPGRWGRPGWTYLGRRVLLELEEEPRKGTPAPLGAFPLTQSTEGTGKEPRKRSRDGTSGDWQLALKESSYLVRELPAVGALRQQASERAGA